MKYNFCPSCGNKLEQEYKFCPACGVELKTGNAPKEKKQTKIKDSTKTSTKKSNSYIILAVSFVFAITVVFLVIRSNQQAKEQETAGNQNQAQMPSGQPTEQMNALMQSVLETKKALETDPLNYDLNVKMGNNAFDIGRFEQAIKYYRTAVSVKSTDPDVLIDLGVAYFNQNNPDSALYFMDSALKISPEHPQGLFNAGIVHFNIGDSLQAIKYWEKLVTTNGDLPQAKTAQKFLEQLKSKLNKS
jgi:tetratricopeptide (TPR) repeat protein